MVATAFERRLPGSKSVFSHQAMESSLELRAWTRSPISVSFRQLNLGAFPFGAVSAEPQPTRQEQAAPWGLSKTPSERKQSAHLPSPTRSPSRCLSSSRAPTEALCPLRHCPSRCPGHGCQLLIQLSKGLPHLGRSTRHTTAGLSLCFLEFEPEHQCLSIGPRLPSTSC